MLAPPRIRQSSRSGVLCLARATELTALIALEVMTKEAHPTKGLTLCVVNYNGERYLDETLGAALAVTFKFEEIILIDNASDDGSLEIVSNRFPSVKTIQLESNGGPGAARNAGSKAATFSQILFVDNDVTLNPDCPDRLCHALDENRWAAIAMPRVLYAHDRDTIQCDGADGHFLGLMTLHNANLPNGEASDATREIGSVVTSCFLLDRDRWRGEDLFDEAFFFVYQDNFFGLRARSLGHRILSVPAAYCYNGGGTAGLSGWPDQVSNRRIFLLIRNRWQIILKLYSARTLLLLLPMLAIYEMFQFSGALKKGWIREWSKAAFWIFSHPVAILRTRRVIQKTRTTPDRQILTGGPVPFTNRLATNSLERVAKMALDRITTAYWGLVKGWI